MRNLVRGAIVAPIIIGVSGCGFPLFEPTLRPNDGIRSEQRNYELSAEQLAAIPQLENEDGFIETHYDEEGRVVKTVERKSYQSWGIPSAPKQSEFTATSEFANSDTALEQFHNGAGSGVQVNRKTAVDEGSYGKGIEGQVQRTDATVDLISALATALAEFGGIKVTREAEVDMAKITADKEVRLKEIEHAPEEVHHEPAPPAQPAQPAEVTEQ